METLRLKTVLYVELVFVEYRWAEMSRTLVLEEYPEANLKWCQSQDIQFMVCILLTQFFLR